jgi:hypothetical protein
MHAYRTALLSAAVLIGCTGNGEAGNGDAQAPTQAQSSAQGQAQPSPDWKSVV